MMRLFLLTLLMVVAGATTAQDAPEPARVFRSALGMALFRCETQSSFLATSERLHGYRPDRRAELSTCVREARAKMKDAYSTYTAAPPPEAELAAAKAYYAATLAFATKVSQGLPRGALDASQESTEVENARALFEIEAGL